MDFIPFKNLNADKTCKGLKFPIFTSCTECAQKLFESYTENTSGNVMILELRDCHLCIAINQPGLVFYSPV